MCYATAKRPCGGRKYHQKHHGRRHRGRHFAAAMYPPVNVEELDDRYEVRLYAAGYNKEDFQVNLKDNTLTVAVQKPKEDATQWTYWRRLEFRPGNFERHFELNDKIDGEAIAAKYENGVLLLTLPKKEGFETIRQEIEIK